MKIIDIFGKYIKPIKLRGVGCVNPTPTGFINENLKCIRQNDVNIWFYTKNGITIAIDTGYKNFRNTESLFEQIDVKASNIVVAFITHADIDHAGGLVSKSLLFENATIYLHEEEEKMLKGMEKRFKCGPFYLRNPISYSGKYTLLKNRQTVIIENIKIDCLHMPGHTNGHSCYLIDDTVLFTGDCIALNDNGGYGFFNFFNMDTKINLYSIKMLKTMFELTPPKIVCTGHSGYSTDGKYFKHIDTIANGNRKRPFDKKAPYNVFID